MGLDKPIDLIRPPSFAHHTLIFSRTRPSV